MFAFLALLVTKMIACLFLGIFDDAVIGTLHCMALDMELNGGTPSYGPPEYHKQLAEIGLSGEGAQKDGDAADPNAAAGGQPMGVM